MAYVYDIFNGPVSNFEVEKSKSSVL